MHAGTDHAPTGPAPTDVERLVADWRAARALTERLAAPLSPEDQQVQAHEFASPTKWHRAHTSWFFDTFLLAEHLPGWGEVEEHRAFLYNSYYVGVGDRHTRARRGVVSRPTAADVAAYREQVDVGMEKLLADHLDGLQDLVLLGTNHEQQHQELLLMDIKANFAVNPVEPAYHDRPGAPSDSGPLTWTSFDGGIVQVGHAAEEDRFAFDNEGPRHEVLLRDFALADRPVTNGEWIAFIEDGGYDTPGLWLSDGWGIVETEGWDAPEYWRREGDGRWTHFTLAGRVDVDPEQPVQHVSYVEADAFARWAGARLPLEAEWEHAAATVGADEHGGTTVGSGLLHPLGTPGPGLRDLVGGVWEWTASPYVAYPGFEPAPGAVGEYNAKFMLDQWVLRGGCALTPDGHTRLTYRNFFPAATRWQASGLRLAR